MPLALATPLSAVSDFYASSSFASYRKSVEGKAKAQAALFARFDGISKQINGLGNLLVKALKR